MNRRQYILENLSFEIKKFRQKKKLHLRLRCLSFGILRLVKHS